MEKPKVSVVVAVYNAERYLEQCLESLRVQTLQEIEIICVNDGSVDDSSKVLYRFAQMDSRFRIVEQKNAGAGAARNNGIQQIRGEYSIFLDADDFFESDMLELAYEEAEREKADIVVFGCDIFENGVFLPCTYSIRRDILPQKQPFALKDVSQEAFRLFTGWAWDKLIRTSLFKEKGLFFQEQRTTNDMLFVFSALLQAERICVKNVVLAHYRREPGSLSVTREKSWHCFYNALLGLRENLKKWDLYSRFERDYLNYCVHFSLWNLETLREPTYTRLYNALRDEWYDELGVLNKPKSYFYDKLEYVEFRRVMEHPAEWIPTVGYHLTRKVAKSKMQLTKIFGLIQKVGLRYTTKVVLEKLYR